MSHQSFGSSLVYIFGDEDGKRGFNKEINSSAENPQHITSFEILQSNDKEEFKTISHDQLHIVDVEMGYTQTILIDKLGRVFGCGQSDRGQAGYITHEIVTPRQIFNLRNEFVKNASCGYCFTLYLTKDGKVFGSGENDSNQFPCIPPTFDGNLPMLCPIPEDIKVKSIHCGYYHSIILDNSGKVYVCGQEFKAFHQLTALNDIFIVNAGGGYESSFFISKEGDVYGCGAIGIESQPAGYVSPVKITGFKHPISDVASGYYHTLFCSTLESGGIMYSCGRGQYNSTCRDIEKGENMKVSELYEHKHFTNICQVNCGGYHSAILNGKEKAVYVFGLSGRQTATKQPYKVTFQELQQNIEDNNNYISVKAIAGGWTSAVLVHKHEIVIPMMKKLGKFISEQSKDHLLFDVVINCLCN